MSTDRHDWDREEREALAGLEDQIDAMRRRHAEDPPIEMLRAAHADALPEDLRTSVSDHMAASVMSRTLADGLGEDVPALSDAEQERLLARIMKEASAAGYGETGRKSLWGWLRPVFVGSGIVAVASVVWMVSKGTEQRERLGPPDTEVVVALPPAVPPFLLPFEKPDVRLGMGALTWRGSTTSTDDGNQRRAALKRGLDAYRQSVYATANRELTPLDTPYPGTIEHYAYALWRRRDPTRALEVVRSGEANGFLTAEMKLVEALALGSLGRAAEAREVMAAARKLNPRIDSTAQQFVVFGRD